MVKRNLVWWEYVPGGCVDEGCVDVGVECVDVEGCGSIQSGREWVQIGHWVYVCVDVCGGVTHCSTV